MSERASYFSAVMTTPDAAMRFGWLVALALLALAAPVVFVMQGSEPTPAVLGGCVLVAIALGGAAWHSRRAALHDVRFESGVLTVRGPRVDVQLTSPLAVRALRGEVVVRRMRMPVHVLVIEEHGTVVLMLQEPVSAMQSHSGWVEATDADLETAGAPVLCKASVPVHLGRLRDALGLVAPPPPNR